MNEDYFVISRYDDLEIFKTSDEASRYVESLVDNGTDLDDITIIKGRKVTAIHTINIKEN